MAISDSEKLMAFYFNGDRSPANLFVYDFGGGAPRKLTDSLNPEISAGDLVDSQVVRFKSSDPGNTPCEVIFDGNVLGTSKRLSRLAVSQ